MDTLQVLSSAVSIGLTVISVFLVVNKESKNTARTMGSISEQLSGMQVSIDGLRSAYNETEKKLEVIDKNQIQHEYRIKNLEEKAEEKAWTSRNIQTRN